VGSRGSGGRVLCDAWGTRGRLLRRSEKRIEQRVSSERAVGGVRGGRVGQVLLAEGWGEEGAVSEVVGSVSPKPARRAKSR